MKLSLHFCDFLRNKTALQTESCRPNSIPSHQIAKDGKTSVLDVNFL